MIEIIDVINNNEYNNRYTISSIVFISIYYEKIKL